jgi:SWI/SNF-related matrix-associated actin-dependent regulator of chromatin subfamily A3
MRVCCRIFHSQPFIDVETLNRYLLAHEIRHQSTRQFRAVLAISAKFRWCLTGTPIQNSLEDLGSLVRFLRVPLLDTAQAFRYHIVSPVESGHPTGLPRLRLLLKSLCLRRTNDILQLPQPVQQRYRLQLSPSEDIEYAKIGETFREGIDRAVSGRKSTEGYNGVLQALLRLRLLCNHGTYEPSAQGCYDALPAGQDEALTILQQSDCAICAYCSCNIASVGSPDDPESGKFTLCSHLLCGECVPLYEADLMEAKHEKRVQCPICQQLIKADSLAPKETKERQKTSHSSMSSAPCAAFDIDGGYSSKLSALRKDIECHMSQDKR